MFLRGRCLAIAAREKPVKKLLMLAAAAIGAQYALKRKKGTDTSEVWKQATRPTPPPTPQQP
jgi:hypothetical protein